MKHQETVDAFFKAYGEHDIKAIKKVMDEHVKWYFMGNHPLAGIKNGVDEVVDFFDQMGKIMATSKPTIEKPIVAENKDYLVECVHTQTNNPDDINIDHMACVLWTFRNDKIIEGRHFFGDPERVSKYFTAMAEKHGLSTVMVLLFYRQK